MLWTSLDGAAPAWHGGTIKKVLKANRSDNFTHDACLDGSRLRRSVVLSEGGHIDGTWMPIRAV
eukprot:4343486-Pleurochrysis_carterae.AAC.1